MAGTPNSDELSAFVTSTLEAIAKGISDAQNTQISSAHGTGTFGFSAPETIEFDVAVSANKANSVDGGLKVAVFGIGANAKGQETAEHSTISRIRFAVKTAFKKNDAGSTSIPTTHTAWNKSK